MLVSSQLAVGYAAGVRRIWKSAGAGRGISYCQVTAFAAGWLTLVTALASPLDEWSETLFVAHMVQHELLMVVAAPLIALSAPLIALLWRAPVGRRRRWIEVRLRESDRRSRFPADMSTRRIASARNDPALPIFCL